MSLKKIELVDQHPNDIAETIQGLDETEQPISFLLLPGALKGEVFAYLDEPTQETVLKSLGSEEITHVLQTTPPMTGHRFFPISRIPLSKKPSIFCRKRNGELPFP